MHLQKPLVYSIVVLNVDAEKLHPSLHRGHYGLMDVTLSVTGRATAAGKGSAWLDSRSIAVELLAYHQGSLLSRWGHVEFEIKEEVASKWQRRWMITSSQKAKELVAKGEIKKPKPKPKPKPKSKSNRRLGVFQIKIKLDGNTAFYTGKEKESFRFSQTAYNAKRYITRKGCERALAGLPDSDHLKDRQVIEFTTEEVQAFEDKLAGDKQLYWELKG